jgi:hypothetical protein
MKITLFLTLWMLSGGLGYILDFFRPKMPGERTINPLRSIFAGPLILLFLIATMFSDPANENEDKYY